MKPLFLALFCSLFVTSKLGAETLPCEAAAKPTLALPDKLALPGGEQATLTVHTPDEVYSAVLLASVFAKLGEAGHDNLVSTWHSMPAQDIQRVVALHTGTATLSKDTPPDAFYESVLRAFIELGWDEYRTYAMSGQDPEWDGYSESDIHEDWVDFADKFIDDVTNTNLDYRVAGAPIFLLELSSFFPNAAVSKSLCQEFYIADGEKRIADGEERIAELDQEVARLIKVRNALREINKTLSGAIDSLQVEE